MYLSHELLARVVERLRAIGPEQGKARQERVSGLSRYLACAALIAGEGGDTASLAVGSEGRNALAGQVGRVLRLDRDGDHTPDFVHAARKGDYGIGSNFLTTGVKDSRGRGPIPNPGRPAPLLLLEDEAVSLHPDHLDHLRQHYALDAIRDALALWLMRDADLPEDPVGLVTAVNADLAVRYGQAVAGAMALRPEGLAGLTVGIVALRPEAPLIADLFGARGPRAAGDDPGGMGAGAAAPAIAFHGRNLIVYGAPGTGKSTRLDRIAGRARVTRTVFHPDLQNSDFFGCLKPATRGGRTEYAFAPGPFAKALDAALAEPDLPWALIIEEINRARAAAVFGELFQLLDREPDGTGSYAIDFPSPESEDWFRHIRGHGITALRLPANLSILASMNSADQGVYPLDTAFRRRWEQDYVPFDYAAGPDGQVALRGAGGAFAVDWRVFVRLLNDRLSAHLQIPEDRFLGQWFVKAHELNGPLPNKILIYLWDDLLRHEGREVIFDMGRHRTFGQLAQAAEAGLPVLAPDFLIELEQAFAGPAG